MMRVFQRVMLGLLACVTLPAAGQQGGDGQALPRVLLIGDGSYIGVATQLAKEELKDQAQVLEARLYAAPVLNSATALTHLDQLLGRVDRNGKPVEQDSWPRWDVIHFNVGLGDMVHVVPDIASFRLLPAAAGGVPATSLQQYEQNLAELVGRLKATGAKLVWASTTPIRASRNGVFVVGMPVDYNRAAQRVMRRERVAINDMYGYVIGRADMDKPAGHGMDPFHFYKELRLQEPVSDSIRQALGLPLPEREQPKAPVAQR